MIKAKRQAAFWALVFASAIFVATMVGRSSRIERVLGARLPSGARILNVHVEYVPDYPIVNGYAKISMETSDWYRLIDRLRLSTNNASRLPDSNLPTAVSDWWKVPDSAHQLMRASRSGDSRRITAVFIDGVVYIEFSGNTPITQ